MNKIVTQVVYSLGAAMITYAVIYSYLKSNVYIEAVAAAAAFLSFVSDVISHYLGARDK